MRPHYAFAGDGRQCPCAGPHGRPMAEGRLQRGPAVGHAPMASVSSPNDIGAAVPMPGLHTTICTRAHSRDMMHGMSCNIIKRTAARTRTTRRFSTYFELRGQRGRRGRVSSGSSSGSRKLGMKMPRPLKICDAFSIATLTRHSCVCPDRRRVV